VSQAQRILQSMGLPVLKEAGVEADDVVGALALRAHGEGMMVSIASPDKDFQQLLRPNLRLVRPDKKVPGQVVPYTVDDFAADYEV
jgi:DNA polymerase-1